MKRSVPIKLNTKIFPLEAIINNCYNYLDKVYLYLDTNPDASRVTVYLKAKGSARRTDLNKIKNEFLNDLLYCAIRLQVNKNNQKIREYIINRALYSAIHPAFSAREDLLALSRPGDKGLNAQDDPLGIALPWEEKYGRGKAKAKKGR